MTALEELDDEALLDLSRRTDPLGVLSVYVNMDPMERRDAPAIDIKNRFRELQRNVAEDDARNDKRDVRAALDRLGADLEKLSLPTEPGRGRVLFAALDGDWQIRLETQMPVPNRVVLGDGAFIHPLLELLDEGRRAGVILVSGDDARLLEWRLGTLDTVAHLEQEQGEAPHERAGHVGGGPSGQYNSPVVEQRQARQREWAQRFLNQVAETADRMAGERKWERILISGGDRWTEPLAGRLPEPLQERVIRDTRVLNGLADGELRSTVSERLHEDHKSREQQLIERIRDAGLSKASGALGPSEVTAALNAGRVAHLVYDPEVRYTGSQGADGALYAGTEAPADGEPATPDTRLTERLVERALATGARISPVEGAAGGVLRDATGIGALLRW